jgi:hypothetical protein
MTYYQQIRIKNDFSINRKFHVPQKQGAHFLGAEAQIHDSWVFSSSVMPNIWNLGLWPD